ncbi:MAG: hypothetical protein K2X53_04390 [Alphaproteobacteria bacterium]|nr:hypothetical protein [Alphaproteobacteria bacterium]
MSATVKPHSLFFLYNYHITQDLQKMGKENLIYNGVQWHVWRVRMTIAATITAFTHLIRLDMTIGNGANIFLVQLYSHALGV